MATAEEFTQAVSSLGFFQAMNFHCGTWRGYAVTISKNVGKGWFASVAVRLPSRSGVRKRLKKAVKALGAKPGVVQQCTKIRVMFAFTLAGADNARQSIQNSLDLMAAALQQCGIGPADSCALTGAPAPDSLCLINTSDGTSYQPVSGAAVQQRNSAVQQKVRENEANGNYFTGLIGAILGMLLGVAINVLTIVGMQRIFVAFFALIPIAAMYGCKLFKGKMNSAALVKVILLSVVALFLIPVAELAVVFMREYGAPLGEAVAFSIQTMTTPDIIGEMGHDLLMMVLFMVLGLFLSIRILRGQTNEGALAGAAIQQETLRPNPNHPAQTAPQPESPRTW